MSFSSKPARLASVPLVAVSLAVAACGSSSEPSSSTAASAATATPAGGGPPGGGGTPGGQQINAVDLNTEGSSAGGTNAAEVIKAANAFLATLSAEQKSKIVYEFSNNQAKQTWSNFPVTFVQREGLALSDLSDDSKTSALALVQTMTGDSGDAQIDDIRAADDYLASLSQQDAQSMGHDTYHIAIYGTPSASEPFMVQFGGHHVARNYTYNGDNVSVTPDFTGVEPTSFETDGKTVEALKGEAHAMTAMIAGLRDEQRDAAELSGGAIDDLLMGPGMDNGEFPTSEGVLVSGLDAQQKALVAAAIKQWVDDAAPSVAKALMAKYESELDKTRIAWAGDDAAGEENTYIRIDGPSVWIEFIDTRSQSTPNVHYHTVWRDKNNDYGSSNVSQ